MKIKFNIHILFLDIIVFIDIIIEQKAIYKFNYDIDLSNYALNLYNY